MRTLCVRVLISGKVQRVGFRYFAKRKARAYGLVGWVRNLKDGSVDAVFQGDEEMVEKIIEWCKEGSPLAQVDNVEVRGESPGAYEEFEILK